MRRRGLLWVTVLLTILGGLLTLLGALGALAARLTGHLDPYHGGRMAFDASVSTLLTGLVLFGSALILWQTKGTGARTVGMLFGSLVILFVLGAVPLIITTAPWKSPRPRGAWTLVAESKRNMKSLATELEVYFIDYDFYPESLADLPSNVQVLAVDPCTNDEYRYEPQGAQSENYRLSIVFPKGSVCASVVSKLIYTPDRGLVEVPWAK